MTVCKYVISMTNIVYLRDGVPSLAVTGEIVLPVNLVDIRLFNILTRSSAIRYHKIQNNKSYNKLDKEQFYTIR